MIKKNYFIIHKFTSVLLFTLLLATYTTHAQFLDSIKVSLKKKPKFIFNFDSRNSFIANQSARIFGWKIGVEFGETLRIGGGFHNLSGKHSPYLDKVITNDKGDADTATLKFGYISYFVEYIFYKKKKWEFSVPFQIGFGSSRYEYKDQNGLLIQLDRKAIVLYEPVIAGHYKITKWFGIGMGAGFRIMLLNNKAIDKKFNSPIYILKVKVFLGDVYRAIVPPRSVRLNSPKSSQSS